ncbi:hypothetical protein ACG7TL_002862 [Trametes sanguinea]
MHLQGYTPLWASPPASTVEDGVATDILADNPTPRNGHGSPNLGSGIFGGWILTLVIAAASISSMVSMLLLMNTLSGTTYAIGHVQNSNLRRPSTYINIEGALTNASISFPPIFNFPLVALQMPTNDSDRQMTEDSRMLRTQYGTVFFDDRHIMVSNTTSTIAQFRHLDYGFERCVLSFKVPLLRPAIKFDPSVHVNGAAAIDVWLLVDEGELNPANQWVVPPAGVYLTQTWSGFSGDRSSL